MSDEPEHRIFISWSLDQGRQLATLTKEWIESIFMTQKCFVSSEDICGGTDWWDEIKKSLDFASVGIFCITDDNKDRPWILYEAGRIAGRLKGKGVIPMVFGISAIPPDNPLAKHQARFCNKGKAQYLKVLEDINNYLPAEGKIRKKDWIKKQFDQSWEEYGPRFEEVIGKLNENKQESQKEYKSEKKQVSSGRMILEQKVEQRQVQMEEEGNLGNNTQQSLLPSVANAAHKLEQRRADEKRKKEQRRKEFIDEINYAMVRVRVLVDKLNIEKMIYAKGSEVNCLYDLAEKLEKDQKVEILDVKLVATEALKDGFFENVQRSKGDVWPVEKSVAQRLVKDGFLKILTGNGTTVMTRNPNKYILVDPETGETIEPS